MISFSRHLTSHYHVNNLDFVSGCRGIQHSSQKKANNVKRTKQIILSTIKKFSSILTGAPSVPGGPEGPKMPREPWNRIKTLGLLNLLFKSVNYITTNLTTDIYNWDILINKTTFWNLTNIFRRKFIIFWETVTCNNNLVGSYIALTYNMVA